MSFQSDKIYEESPCERNKVVTIRNTYESTLGKSYRAWTESYLELQSHRQLPEPHMRDP